MNLNERNNDELMNRNIPYNPSFRRIPANKRESAVDASECISGNQ